MLRIKDVYFEEGFVKMLARLADIGKHVFLKDGFNLNTLPTSDCPLLVRQATVPFSDFPNMKRKHLNHVESLCHYMIYTYLYGSSLHEDNFHLNLDESREVLLTLRPQIG